MPAWALLPTSCIRSTAGGLGFPFSTARLRKLGGPPRKLGPLGFESEHRLARRQIELVAAAAGKETHLAVGLPLIGFKAEGKFAVRRDRARLLGL